MTAAAGTPCGHASAEPVHGGLLSRCRECGLVATTAPPAFEYARPYFTDAERGGYDFEGALARAGDEARFVPELRRLEALGLRGSVLDVGCATGSFLLHAQRRGWSVAGVEIAAYARGVAERRLGLPVAESLDGLPAGARWDVVTLHHVLEHVDDPVSFLRDRVRPRVGRLLLVEVPNFGSLGARVHGTGWRDLRPDQHRWHFDARTLPPLLRQAGFAPRAPYTLWQPVWSLRATRDLLAELPGLLRPPRRGAPPAPPAAADGESWAPPRGVRRAAVEVARIACRPLVAALERAGLGERLVLEAGPAPDPGAVA